MAYVSIVNGYKKLNILLFELLLQLCQSSQQRSLYVLLALFSLGAFMHCRTDETDMILYKLRDKQTQKPILVFVHA